MKRLANGKKEQNCKVVKVPSFQGLIPKREHHVTYVTDVDASNSWNSNERERKTCKTKDRYGK